MAGKSFELTAVELCGASAVCAQTRAWKVLEQQILAKLNEAYVRGVKDGRTAQILQQKCEALDQKRQGARVEGGGQKRNNRG